MMRFRSFGLLASLVGLLGVQANAEAPAASADVQSGRAVALRVCSVCHVVAPDQPRRPMLKRPAPSFRSIANRPATTAQSLHGFMQTTHKSLKTFRDMPALNITDDQTDAVISYILSLRKKS